MKQISSTRRRNRSSAPRFEFITVAGNNVAGDDATRRRVRSHAMVDFRRRTVQPKRKGADTIVLDVTPLLDGSLPSSLPLLQKNGTERQSSADGASLVVLRYAPSPCTLLDANRSDPFGAFPIDESYRSRQLWDHMYDGSCPMFRTMVNIGFLDVVRETIALSQLLSASSRHLEHLHGNDYSTDSCSYAIQATNLLQQRLSDPTACTTDEVVAVVLAFCWYATMFRDPESFNIHMDGLSLILDCRGGARSLDSTPLLRTMLYWADVNGSYLQDSIPRYPQPLTILATRSKLSATFLHDRLDPPPDGRGYERGVTLSQLRQIISELHLIIRSESLERNLWKDIIFPGFHISPILHVLLSQPRAIVYDDVNTRMRECFRLAAIIYLTELRGMFGLDTIPGQFYGAKLRLFLTDIEMALYSRPSHIYLVWALTVGACASCLSDEQRDWFTSFLSKLMPVLRVERFHNFKNMITDFLWSCDALGYSLDMLESRVSFDSELDLSITQPPQPSSH